MYTLARNPKGLFVSMTLLVLGVLFSSSLKAQNVIYVDQTSTGNGDGSTWVDAFNKLEDALTTANSGDEIWIAQGIYLPGDTIQSRFVVDQDVRIYGGFSGVETQLNERDPAQYPTIMSGDVLGDDFPSNTQDNRWDNLYTILEIKANVTSDAMIDGLIFRGGHANGDNFLVTNAWGGAIFCEGAPQIHGCLFEDNFADKRGGAVYIQSDHANGMLIQDCTFFGNRSNEDGGAVFVYQTDGFGVFIENCHYSLNNCERRGGGIAIYNSSAHLSKCIFNNNNARQAGGAVQVEAAYNFLKNTIDSCFFSNNAATRGGAIQMVSASVFGAVGNAFEITSSTFSVNEAMDFTNNPNDKVRGAAIMIESNVNASETSALIRNCSFSGNDSGGEAAAGYFKFDGQESKLVFSGNQLSSNFSVADGPLVVSIMKLGEADILIDSCSFFQNHVQDGSTGFVMDSGESGIVDLVISNTSFTEASGSNVSGLRIRSSGLSQVNGHLKMLTLSGNAGQSNLQLLDENGGLNIDCQNIALVKNTSSGIAGIEIIGMPDKPVNEFRFRFDNLLIREQKGNGVAIYITGEKTLVSNATSAQNEIPFLEVGSGGELALQNCILASSGVEELQAISKESSIASKGGNLIDDASLAEWMTPNDLQEIDPLFLGGNDLGITAASPAVDFGILPENVYQIDLAGNPRIQGNGIDAGAYESPFTSSVDGEITPSRTLEIWPNPAAEAVFISFKDGLSSHVEIRIYNAAGSIVREIQEGIKEGQTQVKISLSGIPSGVHTVQVVTTEGIQAMGSFSVVTSN